MLPKLRKSLQKPEKRISPPSLAPKTPSAIAAPKAVIRALYDYTRGSPQELTFSKGDFFHVVSDDQDPNWFEVCNPATGAQGLVPAQFFQVLGRNSKESAGAQLHSMAEGRQPEPGLQANTSRNNQPSKSAPLYGIVQYDFQAERPDELDAKAGEAIIIIAQSNHEWFVAKPIGRLGGPGLIPVSFIEIRDMSTGQPISNLEEVAARAAVPKVEEWKKAAAEYKKSSIPLGKFDFNENSTTDGQSSQGYVSTQQTNPLHKSSATSHSSSAGGLWAIRASVDQFLMEGARYWFLVRVEMNDGRRRNLCRFYEDFYDFQIALLDEFPVEAGRTGAQRILPFMPGPLAYVDDTISAQRRADLSVYVEELCALPPHIVQSALLQNLFAAREGDVESSHATSMMPQPPHRDFAHKIEDHNSSIPASVDSRHSAARMASQGHTPVHKQQPSMSLQPGEEAVTKAAAPPASIKIKVCYEDDLIAMRLPADVTYNNLCDKLRERLSGSWQSISVKDEIDYLTRTEKIVLYVQ